MIEQLSFIHETYEEKIEKRIKAIEEKFEKIRKSLYAKNSELMKLYIEQKNRADILESALCRSGLKITVVSNPMTFYSIGEKND